MATTTPRRARPATPPRRLTVTSLPSLDPVRAEQLTPFFDTLFGIASRLVAAPADRPSATAA